MRHALERMDLGEELMVKHITDGIKGNGMGTTGVKGTGVSDTDSEMDDDDGEGRRVGEEIEHSKEPSEWIEEHEARLSAERGVIVLPTSTTVAAAVALANISDAEDCDGLMKPPDTSRMVFRSDLPAEYMDSRVQLA